MKFCDPSMHLIAYTHMDKIAERDMLNALGAPSDWTTDATSDSEELIEVMGRLCYKSFGTDINPNITRVREGNNNYLGNIINTEHGSVFEHATATFGFVDVSPVVTHELVRHRQGTAFSQVSMRFVRLTEIGAYYPKAFEIEFLREMFSSIKGERAFQSDDQIDQHAQITAARLREDFVAFVESAEQLQVSMARISLLDSVGNFDLKKRFTSSMRRLAPYGLATSIGVTANHRAWRFMIQQRTSRHAEEEIRLVFGQVAKKLASAFPALYQDMRSEVVSGFVEYTFDHHKI